MGWCREQEAPVPDRLRCDLLNANHLGHIRTLSGQWLRGRSVCKAHRDYGKERAREITGHLVSQITWKADASTTANTTFGHYFYKAYLPSAHSLISEDLVKHAFVMLCFWLSCFLFFITLAVFLFFSTFKNIFPPLAVPLWLSGRNKGKEENTQS